MTQPLRQIPTAQLLKDETWPEVNWQEAIAVGGPL